MSTYAIGDIQGCFDSFMALLSHIRYTPKTDKLWLTGDLVGRGPKSLEVMQYVLEHQEHITIVLGNHDLHALACHLNIRTPHPKDKLDALLSAPDSSLYFEWLRKQKLLHYDETFNTLMVHAGVHPDWNLAQCILLANEVEAVLQKLTFKAFISQMYGDEPKFWRNDLTGIERLRYIVNILTRVRMFKGPDLELELSYKTAIDNQNNTLEKLQPWFRLTKLNQMHRIVFGHWAALQGHCEAHNVFALDTGCVWGGKLSAIRLEDEKIFYVPQSPSEVE